MILRTARLVLRPVARSDADPIAAMNADPRVMDSLGGALARAESDAWLDALLEHWTSHGYGRFFVTHETTFVAVVGLSRRDFDLGEMPGVEIAWRAPFDQWGNGYVTEAARAVLDEGFGRIGLEEIVAATTPSNARSRRVIERLGMQPAGPIEYAVLPVGHPLRKHDLYRSKR